MIDKEQILQRIIRVVNENDPNSEIYLYGSRARGDAREYSDWDFLVLLNRQNIPFEVETRFMDEFYEIELETGEIISPLIYSKNEWFNKHSFTPLYEYIHKEGIRIQ
ncbi:MAG: nucleotidyltransferase domain-containing protein [Bacteroidota bacterium]